MKLQNLHSWGLSIKEAKVVQKSLSERIVKYDSFSEVKTVAGLDIGFHGDVARASCAVFSYPDCILIEEKVYDGRVNFPYIPGFLSFREIPVLASVLEMVETEPDVLIADGQGIAHPRRLGLASHLGVLADKPTIGCAKSILIGRCEEPGNEKGSYTYLIDREEVIGVCLRTRSGVKPVYVSIGNKISLESAREVVLNCCKKYRLPEPIRWAHKLASN